MQFGWLNLSGAAIIALIMIPNIIFAVKNKDAENLCKSRVMNAVEQAGRYGSMAFMIIPLFARNGGFGFTSANGFVLWLAICAALILAYFAFWLMWFNGKNRRLSVNLGLAIAPSLIFILRGIFLGHPLLIGFGVIFALGHIYVTVDNLREAEKRDGAKQ